MSFEKLPSRSESLVPISGTFLKITRKGAFLGGLETETKMNMGVCKARISSENLKSINNSIHSNILTRLSNSSFDAFFQKKIMSAV